MSSLRARLANRHAEKLIPPAELQHIQQLWDDSNRAEKVEIFNELDSYNTDQVKRLFQLIARQRKTFCKKTVLYDLFEGNGVKSLISIREASVKERVKGQSVTTLTDVLQSNLDSSLDINQVTLDSSVLPRLYHVSLLKFVISMSSCRQTAFTKSNPKSNFGVDLPMIAAFSLSPINKMLTNHLCCSILP